MSQIFRAILPKMHVNHNTSRAIVHGPEELGGLNLPNMYVIQGVDKLKLFLGHLRIQDRTGQLLHIALGYLQLLSGTGSFTLNLDYEQFRWVETGWLTSLWEFTSKSMLTFDYPLQWLPSLPWSNDIFIMDHFCNQDCKDNIMGLLSRCRLYLQVITLSDITSADGMFKPRKQNWVN
jgi:hypothetical protein